MTKLRVICAHPFVTPVVEAFDGTVRTAWECSEAGGKAAAEMLRGKHVEFARFETPAWQDRPAAKAAAKNAVIDFERGWRSAWDDPLPPVEPQ